MKRKKLPLVLSPNETLNYQVSIEKTDLIHYENNELLGMKAGTSKVEVLIPVGNRTILLTSLVTIEEKGGLTEEGVLNRLGLRKKNNTF